MSEECHVTTDHNTIRHWAEEREGKPGVVRGTEHGSEAVKLQIDFPGHSGEDSLHDISWEEFFRLFDEEKLAFVYKHDTAHGEQSTYCKVVERARAGRYDESQT